MDSDERQHAPANRILGWSGGPNRREAKQEIQVN